MYTWEILCLCVSVLCFVVIGLFRTIFDLKYHLPHGPPPIPYFGSFSLISSRELIFKTLHKMRDWFGPIFVVYFGHSRVFILSDAKEIAEYFDKSVSVSDCLAPNTTEKFCHLKTNSEAYLFFRKSFKQLSEDQQDITYFVSKELDLFHVEVDERTHRPFKPKSLLDIFATNVVTYLALHDRFDYDSPGSRQFLSLLSPKDNSSLFQRLFSLYLPTYQNPMFYHGSIMNGKSAHLQKSRLTEYVNEKVAAHSVTDTVSILDLFLCSQSESKRFSLSNEAFITDLSEIMSFGIDSTAILTNWIIFYLSIYPDIQRKCHDSLDRVIHGDRKPNLSDRSKLKYIQAVLFEVFRAASIVPYLINSVNGKSISVCDYDIPKNSYIVCNLWSLHHDQFYWLNPDKFIPERWLNPKGDLLYHSSHFLPFGFGRSKCLGETLVTDIIFLFTTSLLFHYTFALADAKVSMDNSTFSNGFHCPPDYKIVITKR